MRDGYEELKMLLAWDSVLKNYNLTKQTRLYVDDGPAGVAATVAQLHTKEWSDHSVWRPVKPGGIT